MEQSALVLIDFNDAISNGYVELSVYIKKLMESTGKRAGAPVEVENSEIIEESDNDVNNSEVMNIDDEVGQVED